MKISFLTFVFFIFTNMLFSQSKLFEGAWFDIKYPASFIAKGSLKSTTSEGFESAIFTSPDHAVEFYIFSPQWSGVAEDIELRDNEILAKTETQHGEFKEVIWWTITAKDNTYSRAYVEIRNKLELTNHVFGIKYLNVEALNRYKKEYDKFKKSLIQYAD